MLHDKFWCDAKIDKYTMQVVGQYICCDKCKVSIEGREPDLIRKAVALGWKGKLNRYSRSDLCPRCAKDTKQYETI